MIHNSFQLNKKLEKMEQEINELKIKNSELTDNIFLKGDKFIELTHRLNNLSLELVSVNEKLENTLEKLHHQRLSLCDNGVDYSMSTEVENFIEINGFQKYTERFKYLGIQKIEDFLILNTYELNENGVLYVDAKKIIESAKESVETSEVMV